MFRKQRRGSRTPLRRPAPGRNFRPERFAADQRAFAATKLDRPNADEALRKSRGCLECHAGIEPMHASPNVVLGCTDCHGGNRDARPDASTRRTSSRATRSSGKPRRIRTTRTCCSITNRRSSSTSSIPAICAWRRRPAVCATARSSRNVGHSMMNHGAMLWGAALYNNGAYPAEELSLRPGLRRRRRAAALDNPVPVTPEDDAAARHSAVPRSAAALQR